MSKSAIVAANKVDSKILTLRGHRVILDSDLAGLYGVEVRHLNQQVKRNAKRFQSDFRFQLSAHEVKLLRSQNVISTSTHGGARYLPYAFTEHGVIMAATVLNSDRAIEMSVFVVQAFVRMRRALSNKSQVLAKLAEVERRLETHDTDIETLMEAIRELIEPPDPPRRRIGFEAPGDSEASRSRASKTRTHRFPR